MSATLESPIPWRKAAEQFVSNGLIRSRSTQFELAAKAGTAQQCAAEVPSSVGRWRHGESVVVNGVGCSPSASPSLRRRVGLSSLNKLCHHLQINVSCLRAPERGGRILSQSTEAIGSPRVQTAPAAQVSFLPPRVPPPAPPVVPKPSFSAPVEGATATVLVGNAQDGPTAAAAISTTISSVRAELVAGLVTECSVVDQLLLIDCRSFVAYNSNHVRGALNISCSDCISRKRLLTGRVTIGDLVSGSDGDAKLRYQRAADAVSNGNKNAVQARHNDLLVPGTSGAARIL